MSQSTRSYSVSLPVPASTRTTCATRWRMPSRRPAWRQRYAIWYSIWCAVAWRRSMHQMCDKRRWVPKHIEVQLNYLILLHSEIIAERSVELSETGWRPVGSACEKESKRHVWRAEGAAAWSAAHQRRSRGFRCQMEWAQQLQHGYERPKHRLSKLTLILSLDLASYRPVYAPKDLLEVLLSLKGPTRPNEDNE